jgi:hypothetical protein
LFSNLKAKIRHFFKQIVIFKNFFEKIEKSSTLLGTTPREKPTQAIHSPKKWRNKANNS